MPDAGTLKESISQRGPYAVWQLMTDDERRQAAAALWQEGDRDTRAAIDLALAKELKFRPQSVRRLAADRVVGRLLRMADDLPENLVFQFLFHLHMAERRPLLVEFLDAVGLPHTNGVLELADDTEPPTAETVAAAAEGLVANHGRQALVYLATLKVADGEFWSGLDQILARFSQDGSPLDAAAD